MPTPANQDTRSAPSLSIPCVDGSPAHHWSIETNGRRDGLFHGCCARPGCGATRTWPRDPQALNLMGTIVYEPLEQGGYRLEGTA